MITSNPLISMKAIALITLDGDVPLILNFRRCHGDPIEEAMAKIAKFREYESLDEFKRAYGKQRLELVRRDLENGYWAYRPRNKFLFAVQIVDTEFQTQHVVVDSKKGVPKLKLVVSIGSGATGPFIAQLVESTSDPLDAAMVLYNTTQESDLQKYWGSDEDTFSVKKFRIKQFMAARDMLDRQGFWVLRIAGYVAEVLQIVEMSYL